MTEEEEKQVQAYKEKMRPYVNQFNATKNFIFITYSHKDALRVYPKVLEWMEQGYNVYIDLEFANHSSEEGWLKQMQAKLQSECCRLAVCFQSQNYFFSYASLVELLTMRPKYQRTTKIHIDVIKLDGDADRETVRHLADRPEEEYRKTQRSLEKNASELAYISERLRKWLKSIHDTAKVSMGIEDEEEYAELIKNKIDSLPPIDFYLAVHTVMENWFRAAELNQNTKSLNDSFAERFAAEEIFRVERAVPPHIDQPAQRVKAPMHMEPAVPAAPMAPPPVVSVPPASSPSAGISYAMTLGAFRDYVADEANTAALKQIWSGMEKVPGYVVFGALLGGPGISGAARKNFVANIAEISSNGVPSAGTWSSAVAGCINGTRKLEAVKDAYPALPEHMRVDEVRKLFEDEASVAFISKTGKKAAILKAFDTLFAASLAAAKA